MKDNLIKIKSLLSEMEAEIISGKLKANGIESFISKDDCGGTDPVMQTAFGVHIMVKEKDSKEALSLIGESEKDHSISRSESSKSIKPFWIIMFLGIGTGLFLSGHAYYPSLTKYGVVFVIIGAVLWLSMRFKREK